jgi:hypothetical protein
VYKYFHLSENKAVLNWTFCFTILLKNEYFKVKSDNVDSTVVKLSPYRLSSLACLQVRPKATRVKHLSGAPFYGRLLALPTNTRLGWKFLPGTNILAYYGNLKITSVMRFMIQAPGVMKLFFFIIDEEAK